MPIQTDIPIRSSDGDDYIFKGGQFRNIRTGRIASVKIRMELESRAIELGLVIGESAFQELLRRSIDEKLYPEMTQRAIEWMRKEASSVKPPYSVIRGELLSEAEFIESSGISTGKVVLFQYEATTDKKLKYWDAFPVVIPIEKYKDGFLGINVHYLPPSIRAFLLDRLYNFRIPKKVGSSKGMLEYKKNVRLDVSYEKIDLSGGYRFIKPTIHRYVSAGFKSRILEIPVQGWTTVMFLPVQDFRKASKEKVWRESIAKIQAGDTRKK